MSKNYKKSEVLKAIINSRGVMEYVALKLKCSWATAKKYVNKWDETKEAFDLDECKLHGYAYMSFHKAIERGERWAIERLLDTSARRNGHGIVNHNNTEIETSGKTTVENIVMTKEEYKEVRENMLNDDDC